MVREGGERDERYEFFIMADFEFGLCKSSHFSRLLFEPIMVIALSIVWREARVELSWGEMYVANSIIWHLCEQIIIPSSINLPVSE